MKKVFPFVLAGLFFLTGLSALAAQTEAMNSPLQGKKVLLVYGGWDGHEPEKCMEYFRPWLEQEGAEVTVSDNLDIYTDSVFMHSLDLVIQIWTMGEISPQQVKGLTQAVASGVGFAGWHGGAGDSFREAVSYQYMVGGQWVAHPGGFVDYTVNIVDKKDPITKGIKDFAMHSEQYYMHIDPNVKVLATTEFNGEVDPWIDGCVIPVMWKKQYGQGRIFYTSLGHKLDHLKTPAAMTTVKRGIRWASESKQKGPEKWTKPVYR